MIVCNICCCFSVCVYVSLCLSLTLSLAVAPVVPHKVSDVCCLNLLQYVKRAMFLPIFDGKQMAQ